jgi:CBS domain-containing protein
MTLLVRDVMTIGVPICRETETCSAVAARLGRAPVVMALDSAGQPCGWATRDELAQSPAERPVAEAMHEEIPTVLPDMLAEAAALMMRVQNVAYLFLMHAWPGEPRPSAYIAREAIEQKLLEGEHVSLR